MGAPKKARKPRVMDPEDRWFEVYRQMREELRGAPDLPADYNPVLEMAKLGMRDDIGPALKFLCHKEAASYMYPRMESAPMNGRALPPGAPALPPVTRFSGGNG